jgi:radical SAM protein with 4Fe4S-binding SPASM domain
MLYNLRDKYNFFSKLNNEKIFNALKVYLSYQYSKLTGKNFHHGFPFSISIEPTTACNLGCPECPSGLKKFTRPTGNLKEEFFNHVLDSVSSKVTYMNFYFQGEPFINAKFLGMVKSASKRKIYTSTSTNAHFITDEVAKKTVESGLDRLIISIDGTTQEVYENYRIHGKLSKVIEGTEKIVKWKKELKSKTPYLIFQFLVVKPNENQVNDIKLLAKKLGVNDVKFKTAQVYNFKYGNELIPTIEKYARYKKQSDGTYSIKNNLVNSCWKMWHSCVITWDGLVVPCCFDKDAEQRLGDLKEFSFQEIWKGKKYNLFRQSLLKGRSEIEICQNCSEGTKVWA